MMKNAENLTVKPISAMPNGWTYNELKVQAEGIRNADGKYETVLYHNMNDRPKLLKIIKDARNEKKKAKAKAQNNKRAR